jgi:hypothetical protein
MAPLSCPSLCLSFFLVSCLLHPTSTPPQPLHTHTSPARFHTTHARALAAGAILYHGPVAEVLPHFAALGFDRPPRKDLASFLQEVSTPAGQLAYASQVCAQASSRLQLTRLAWRMPRGKFKGLMQGLVLCLPRVWLHNSKR